MDKKEIIRRLKRMSEHAVYMPGKPPFIMSLDDGVAADEAAVLLEEQEQDIQNLIADLDDLRKEHEKLLDKKIPLITSGQEVIRCKDCKYCEYPDAEKEWCKKGHLHGNAETWFCADGERKGGAELGCK